MDFKLNKKSNIRAGIVFANIFNLQAEITDIINEDYFGFNLTQNGAKVGTITSKDGKVRIEAKTEDFVLKANYVMPKINGLSSYIDAPANHFNWSTNVKFNLATKRKFNIKGTVGIHSIKDNYYGDKCSCTVTTEISHPNPNFGTIQLNLNTDLNNLYLSHITETVIDRAIFQFWCQRLTHEVLSDFDENKNWHMRKWNSVTINDPINSARKLHTQSSLDKDLKDIYCYDEEKNVVSERGSMEESILLGTEMQKSDPDLYKKINQIKNYLKLGKFSLLDSFVNASFNNQDYEATEPVLGYVAEPVKWQNGANNLENAYFGNYYIKDDKNTNSEKSENPELVLKF